MCAWIQNHRELWNQYQRNYYNKKIRRKRFCVVCGAELKGTKTKYCDQLCRDLASREKDIERKKKWNRAHPHKFLGTHAPEANLTLVKDELGRIRVKGALILKRLRYMRINCEDTSKTG